MTATSRASGLPAYSSDKEKGEAGSSSGVDTKHAAHLGPGSTTAPEDARVSLSSEFRQDTTHRRLKSRHIQLIGIGGTIGTALYVRTVHMYLCFVFSWDESSMNAHHILPTLGPNW